KEAIAIVDPDGRYLQQNGAHFTLLGYPDDVLKETSLADELGAETFAALQHQLTDEGEFSDEILLRTNTGEERNIELSCFTMRSGLGEPLCYICVKRDITTRKQDEAALRRSESELIDFFEHASVGFYWAGPSGTILRPNQAE